MQIIPGKNAVFETLKSGRTVSHLYVSRTAKRDGKIDEILNVAKARGVPWTFESPEEVARRAGVDAERRVLILAVCGGKFQYFSLEAALARNAGADRLFVALDRIEDPHNFGAILRSCAAAGVEAAVIPENRACAVTSTVAAASAGGVERVAIVRVPNLVQALNRLKQEGFWTIGADERAEDPFWAPDYRGKTILVLGNEGAGLARLTRETCDRLVRIPTQDEFSSLNVSVAAGILIFEAARQRRKEGVSG